MASILLVDENRLFREGVRCILARLNFRVAGEATSFADALQLLQKQADVADLVLGDPGSDPTRDFEAMAAIQRQFPNIKIVILADRLTQPWSEPTLGSGADGFLSQDISAEALQHALNLVLTGEKIIPTATLRGAFGRAHPVLNDPAAEILAALGTAGDGVQKQSLSAPSEAGPVLAGTGGYAVAARTLATLSGRENQILDCLVHGLPNKLIARQLDMAEATVKVHLKALLRKLKAKNRTQAAIWAIRSRATEPRAIRPAEIADPAPPTMSEMRPELRAARGLTRDRPSTPLAGRPSALTRKTPSGVAANDQADGVKSGAALLN